MKRYRKNDKFIVLVLILLTLTLGYSALSTNLKINGTTTINKNTWNIYWDNIANKKGVTPISEPVISEDEYNNPDTLVTWSVKLDKPGDFYEFTIDAVNDGSLDAMVDTISSTVNNEDVSTLPPYVSYSVTYKNNVTIKENQILKGNTHETYKVRLELLRSITPEQLNSMPSAGLNYSFKFAVTYKQATENSIDVGMGSNPENTIMLDVARRYYTVDEIKEYIDILSTNKNSALQLHLTDDENVGIECTYLDQTAANATVSNGIYTNPVTGKKFLTYSQMDTIKAYAKTKNVEIIPEIDVPAHMNGFFTLAIEKFGESYVRAPYDWDTPSNSGIAWGSGDEAGNIDLALPQAKTFIKNLYDEYTNYFKDCKIFHVGFDEYPFRPELKIDFANEMYTYLNNKKFIMRMWSDPITKTNMSDLNNNIEITYWGWKEADITETNYATVPDLQNAGFKLLITNKYYLFFVPSPSSTTEEALEFSINKVKNGWTVEKWNYNFDSSLNTYDNILGGEICVWGEDSDGIDGELIVNHTENLYKEMIKKLNN